jgi:hypothetical protein
MASGPYERFYPGEDRGLVDPTWGSGPYRLNAPSISQVEPWHVGAVLGVSAVPGLIGLGEAAVPSLLNTARTSADIARRTWPVIKRVLPLTLDYSLEGERELRSLKEHLDKQPVYQGTADQWAERAWATPGYSTQPVPDLDFVYSGEGMTAYGWGMYFAETPGVARSYRRGTVANKVVPSKVLERYFKPGRIVRGYGGYDQVVEFLPEGHDPEHPWHWQVTVRALSPKTTKDYLDGKYPHGISPTKTQHLYGDERLGPTRSHQTMPDAANIAEALGEELGAVYEFELPRTVINKMIDWDAGYYDQTNDVQQILQEVANEIEAGEKERNWGIYGAYDGALAYKTLAELIRAHFWQLAEYDEDISPWMRKVLSDSGMQDFRELEMEESHLHELGHNIVPTEMYDYSLELASRYLASKGIPGIKYFQGGVARATGQGPRNYVVFDQKVLDRMPVKGKL